MHVSKISALRSLMLKAVVPVAMLLSVAGLSTAAHAADAIVGTWMVKASDAPFQYHMFVFNADGTMQQANPDAGDENTSDSDGKGVWINKDGKVIGKFVEFTADRTTHKLVARGEISYEIEVAGDKLAGKASASFYDAESDKLLRGPFPTPLEGKRVTLP